MSVRSAVCCILLASCASATPPVVTAPPATSDASVSAQPPQPSVAAASQEEEDPLIEPVEPAPGESPRPAPLPSTLRVGVTIPLTPIRDAANAATPELVGEESRPTNWDPFHFFPGYSYRATRGAIGLVGAGAEIQWSVPIALQASAELVGPCTASLTAHTTTRLSISPRWRWVGASTRGPVEWHEPCRVLLGLVDATSRIEPHVHRAQDEMARAIDERIATQNLEPTLAAFWTTLQARMALGDEFGLWLRPSRIGVSALTAIPNALEATIEIAVRPVAAVQAPPDARPIALPPNTTIASSTPDFTLYADVELPLTRIASEIESRASLPLSAIGWELVTVRAIGARDAVYFGFVLDEPIRRTLWFGAVLVLNREQRMITVSRVAATEDTRALLRQLGVDASMVETAFASGLEFPLGDRMDAIRTQYRTAVASALRMGTSELSITPGRLEVVGLFHTPSTIGVTLAIGGTATLVLSRP